MTAFLLRRLAYGLATLAAGTFIVFLISHGSGESAAAGALGEYANAEQRAIWMASNGYDQPLPLRYLSWLSAFVRGDFGWSRVFNQPVAEVLGPRLRATFLLMVGFFALVVPLAFAMGVAAGLNEGRPVDRLLSAAAIVLTSTPPYAMAVLLSLVFVFKLGWLPGTSGMMDGFSLRELVLPVLVLVLFDGGYIAGIVRASTAEVAAQPYVRTARLKAMPRRRLLVRHVLRNALIAPTTVLFVHVNWVLTGVVVVEYFFAYKGFGSLILQASLSRDIDLLAACTVVTIAVAVVTQTLGDLVYSLLDPRIRLA